MAEQSECRYPCGCDQFGDMHCACMDGHTPAPTSDALTAETSGGLVEILAAHEDCWTSSKVYEDRTRSVHYPCGIVVSPVGNLVAANRAHLASAISAAGWGPVGEVEAERDFWRSERWAAQELVNSANARALFAESARDAALAECDPTEPWGPFPMGGFEGCTTADADHCACATDEQPTCRLCSEDIEPGEQAWARNWPCYDTLPMAHADQDFDVISWHDDCDSARIARADSPAGGGR